VGAASDRGAGILDDLLRIRAGEVGGIFELDLVEADGLRCPFAGMGVDAQIIDAYARVKSRYRPLGRWMEGSLGYAVAVATKSLPYYLSHRKMPEIEVVNTGSTAFRLDSNGRPVGHAIETGEVLYCGPAKVVAGSTLPHFGFDLRFFPFAGRRRGNMHLRIFSGSALGVLTHLRQTFRGTYFPKGVSDFYCQSVHIRASQPMPLEIGGDPCGERSELNLKIADRPVELVSFKKAA
jgi:diacylglycerol kinase family enzyme